MSMSNGIHKYSETQTYSSVLPILWAAFNKCITGIDVSMALIRKLVELYTMRYKHKLNDISLF